MSMVTLTLILVPDYGERIDNLILDHVSALILTETTVLDGEEEDLAQILVRRPIEEHLHFQDLKLMRKEPILLVKM